MSARGKVEIRWWWWDCWGCLGKFYTFQVQQSEFYLHICENLFLLEIVWASHRPSQQCINSIHPVVVSLLVRSHQVKAGVFSNQREGELYKLMLVIFLLSPLPDSETCKKETHKENLLDKRTVCPNNNISDIRNLQSRLQIFDGRQAFLTVPIPNVHSLVIGVKLHIPAQNKPLQIISPVLHHLPVL